MSTRLGLLSLFTILVPCGQLFAADLRSRRRSRPSPSSPTAPRSRAWSMSASAAKPPRHRQSARQPLSGIGAGERGGRPGLSSARSRRSRCYADAAVSEQERQLQAEIVDLQDRRHAAEDRVASLQVQLDFIATIGRDMPTTANQEVQRGSMDPAKWQAAWTAMSGGAAEAHAGMRAAEIEMRDIDAKTAKLQQELAQIQTGRSATVVARINLEAGAAENATLRLSYQLPDATWAPLYDARLDSEAGKMSLAQLGQVQQRTGEDWTASPSRSRPPSPRSAPPCRNWTAGSSRSPSPRSTESCGATRVRRRRPPRPSRRTWPT